MPREGVTRKKATKLQRKKVGLALGGGAAWGLAHIGVIEVLRREEIPIDMIAGTSAGAIIGALCAQNKSCAPVRELLENLDLRRVVSLVDPVLPRNGFVGGRRLTELLRKIVGDVEFSDLNIPFACVATDIIAGEEIVINQGSVVAAVRASIAIPGIFTLAKWRGRYLVDGSLLNTVPVSVVKKMGADFIIAVNVMPDISERPSVVTKEGKKRQKEPNIINVLLQSFYISTCLIAKTSLAGADVVIHPNVAHIGPGEFLRAPELIMQGELAAWAAVPEIKERPGIK